MTTNSICRMCLVTHKTKPISELIRIVRTSSKDIVIEKDEHILGRGAYISKDKDIILIAQKKNLISRALKCDAPSSIYDELIKLI